MNKISYDQNLNGYKFSKTPDGKPGFIPPGGADTVIPFNNIGYILDNVTDILVDSPLSEGANNILIFTAHFTDGMRIPSGGNFSVSNGSLEVLRSIDNISNNYMKCKTRIMLWKNATAGSVFNYSVEINTCIIIHALKLN